MRRTIIFVCIGVALLAGTLAGCKQVVGDEAKAQDTHSAQAATVEGNPVFTPVMVDTPLEMVMAKPASSPGEFIVMCNNLEGPREALFNVLDVKLAGRTASITVLNSSAKRVSPDFLTSDGLLLDLDMDTAGVIDGIRQFKRSAYLLDATLTKRDDVTPVNYSEITQPVDAGTAKYSCSALWDQEVGLVVSGWDTKNHVMKIWVGKNNLAEAGSVDGVLANVKFYLNGRFTYGSVTQDGKLFAYDFRQHRFGHITEYDTIASALSRTITAKEGKQVRCTLTKNFALYGNSQQINLITSGGKVWSYNLVSSLDYRPNGDKRSESEANELVEGRMRDLLKEEAAKLAPQFLSSHSRQISLGDDAIGMLDTLYSRLVVITVE